MLLENPSHFEVDPGWIVTAWPIGAARAVEDLRGPQLCLQEDLRCLELSGPPCLVLSGKLELAGSPVDPLLGFPNAGSESNELRRLGPRIAVNLVHPPSVPDRSVTLHRRRWSWAGWQCNWRPMLRPRKSSNS